MARRVDASYEVSPTCKQPGTREKPCLQSTCVQIGEVTAVQTKDYDGEGLLALSYRTIQEGKKLEVYMARPQELQGNETQYFDEDYMSLDFATRS